MAQMIAAGEKGSIVSLLCDGADRYQASYYDDGWLAERGLQPDAYTPVIEKFFDTGRWA